jgi:hypothetical protein
VDDLLATLGLLVMIVQLAVMWTLTIYQPPTLAAFYAVVLPCPIGVWYVHLSCSCPFSIPIYVFFLFPRLARGSILASVIRIMPSGPLRVGALYVSGLFVAFSVACLAQFVWVCEMNIRPNSMGYVPIFTFERTLYPSHIVVMNGPHPASQSALIRDK